MYIFYGFGMKKVKQLITAFIIEEGDLFLSDSWSKDDINEVIIHKGLILPNKPIRIIAKAKVYKHIVNILSLLHNKKVFMHLNWFDGADLDEYLMKCIVNIAMKNNLSIFATYPDFLEDVCIDEVTLNTEGNLQIKKVNWRNQ